MPLNTGEKPQVTEIVEFVSNFMSSTPIVPKDVSKNIQSIKQIKQKHILVLTKE
jgi:hypothetical protein